MTPRAALDKSLRLLAARPGASLALGASLVLSLVLTCCGLGWLLGPWFAVQLLALQLAQLRADAGGPAPTLRWSAVALTFAGLSLVALASGLVLVVASGGSGQAALSEAPAPVELSQLLLRGGSHALLFAFAVTLLYAPFAHAPLLLIDQRGGPFASLCESARIFFQAGSVRQLWLLGVGCAVPLLPLLWIANAPRVAGAGLALALAGAGVPLLILSLPVGLGMLAVAHVDGLSASGGLARAAVGYALPPTLVATWSALLGAPLLCALLLCGALVQPARVSPGGAPAEGALAVVADVQLGPSGAPATRTVYPPTTTLRIELGRDAVSVAASDGGGAGELPQRFAGPLDRVRVLRTGGAYAIELFQRGRVSHTWIDRAGVRLDDGLRARLLDRVPPVALFAVAVMLAAILVLAAPVLAAFGRLRRAHQRAGVSAHLGETLAEARARVVRRGWLVAGLAGPAALWSGYWAFGAIA